MGCDGGKYPDQFSGEYPGTDEARTSLSRTSSPPNKIERKNGSLTIPDPQMRSSDTG